MPSDQPEMQSVVAPAKSTKRQEWIALTLAILITPAIGMLYLGRPKRALLYFALIITAGYAPFFMAAVGLWPKNTTWLVFVIPVWLGGVLDASRIAKKQVEGDARPWYSRWYGLSGIVLFAWLLLEARHAFIVEAFRVPSVSMIPTLLAGDYILVNKFAYGITVPVTNDKVVKMDLPKRGEVMVFRYPENPALIYVQRVVGVGGDRIDYHQKKLSINGEEVKRTPAGDYSYVESGLNYVYAQRFEELISTIQHSILMQQETPSVHLSGVRKFPFRDECTYNETGFTCTVPAGNYFLMGDNRDSSNDSRYWGFVPEENILGRVFMIGWNLELPNRTGNAIH